MSSRLSVILSGIAFALLAILLLIMNRGPSASNAVVIIMWLAIFIIATICAISGIVLGVIGLRKPGKVLAVVGIAAGIVYIIAVSILLTMLIEFVRSVTD